MRYIVTEMFENWLGESGLTISRVAIVGGSTLDPEFIEVKRLFPNVEVDIFGIENSQNEIAFHFLDLNRDQIKDSDIYDLVLCSQVLEHVWNLENAFACLNALTKPAGYLWLACPASNMPHGSPDYYSAGYTCNFLANNLELRNYEIIFKRHFGSKRNYFFTHSIRQWVNRSEHDNPLKGYEIKPGTFLGNTRKLIRELPGRFVSCFYSGEINDSIDYATESVVLAKLKS